MIQIQPFFKIYTAVTSKTKKNQSLPLWAHTGPPGVGGEGHTVPERVGPRGADNATNHVLVCLPCVQAVPLPGRRPLLKKQKTKTTQPLCSKEHSILTLYLHFSQHVIVIPLVSDNRFSDQQKAVIIGLTYKSSFSCRNMNNTHYYPGLIYIQFW